MKKCMYCKADIPEENIIDFCEKCGISVFGSKMFETIKDNMEKAQARGDLYQGGCQKLLTKNPADSEVTTVFEQAQNSMVNNNQSSQAEGVLKLKT